MAAVKPYTTQWRAGVHTLGHGWSGFGMMSIFMTIKHTNAVGELAQTLPHVPSRSLRPFQQRAGIMGAA